MTLHGSAAGARRLVPCMACHTRPPKPQTPPSCTLGGGHLGCSCTDSTWKSTACSSSVPCQSAHHCQSTDSQVSLPKQSQIEPCKKQLAPSAPSCQIITICAPHNQHGWGDGPACPCVAACWSLQGTAVPSHYLCTPWIRGLRAWPSYMHHVGGGHAIRPWVRH